jgi:predicted RND superfamily exporter protein
LANLIESLMQDQLTSFAISAVAILIMMFIAYRHIGLAAVLLLPNMFPIVLVIGAVGWVGLPINIATAMIASVSMGLTVDSSIHYVSGYRAARARGLSCSAALRETHQGIGLALVLANVALVAGFSVLTLSHFIPLVYFGILVSVAMLGGLMGNLILLPLLLRLIDREASVSALDLISGPMATAQVILNCESTDAR